jgi:hypothetical protein
VTLLEDDELWAHKRDRCRGKQLFLSDRTKQVVEGIVQSNTRTVRVAPCEVTTLATLVMLDDRKEEGFVESSRGIEKDTGMEVG